MRGDKRLCTWEQQNRKVHIDWFEATLKTWRGNSIDSDGEEAIATKGNKNCEINIQHSALSERVNTVAESVGKRQVPQHW